MQSTPQPLILVVEDEPGVRACLSAELRNFGYRVIDVATLAAARGHIECGVDAIVLDHELPDGTGIDLIEAMRERLADVPVILLTAHASTSGAVAAMRAGAFYYLEKPLDSTRLRELVANALASTRITRLVSDLRDDPRAAGASPIIGRSRAMQGVLRLIERVSSSPASTVLVTGESGTGKDLVAHAIHEGSHRASRPLLNITCSAMPAALLESELFGHERGAFTDAVQRKIGLLEHADGGTVFLDEIGEMEPALQAKLLRFLEDKTFRRVGGGVDFRADVRVVAATNVDLREAVRQQRFREDLYYRLAVLTVSLPPLREREGDVELLAMHFVDRFNRDFERRIRTIDSDAMQLLQSYEWPGNVRELRNAIERAVLLSRGDTLTVEDLGEFGAPLEAAPEFRLPAGGVDMREVERSLVEQALDRAEGNKTRAGKLLGLNRDQIRYRLERYGHRGASRRD